MSSNDEIGLFHQQFPGYRYLDVVYPDLCCIMRGKRYPAEQAEKVLSAGMMLPASSAFLSVTGESQDPLGMGISDGDPDQIAEPIPGTLSPVPWAQWPTAQVLVTLKNNAGEPLYYEPRNVLRRVLDRFASLKLNPVVAFELEFYLFDTERDKNNLPQPPASPLTGQRLDATQVYSLSEVEDFAVYIDAVCKACREQGIPTGAITAEYAPGQFEINLQHSDDPLLAADRCMLFRRVVQGVARQQGMQASFMAKPYPDYAGSGLHIHISLVDEHGRNAFDGGGDFNTADCLNETARHALGGLLAIQAGAMGIFAPNVNSFRRFVPNLFVPVRRSWGYNNRSVALRIPQGEGNARRIEHRAAGADANPYLVLAALLSGIHYGIEHQLDPGAPSTGNACLQTDPGLPFTLNSALDRLSNSDVLANYLDRSYLDTYTSCKTLEWRSFQESLQNAKGNEHAWYLLT